MYIWISAFLLPVFFGWYPVPASQNWATEICDNALDDDGDGRIDLNDVDCDCALAEPVSLVPNPSFEENLCCPQWRSELHCAETWIQASEATTDYIHTCGWMGWENMPVPLPLPDGDAVVGYRNGRFGQESVPGWKEYAGACLLSPLRAGNSYRFRFNVGFTDALFSPPTSVVFFGSTSCENLPFGIGDPNFGCPTNGEGWQQLGAVSASGRNSWVERTIDITPEEDIYAIAIGPNCTDLNAGNDIYYFFDNLVLAEESAFEFQIGTDGNPCDEGYEMRVPAYDTLSYQWYRNGIALVGETRATLLGSRRSGKYEVRITSDVECKLTRVFDLQVKQSTTQLEQVICPGDEVDFYGRRLASTGLFVDTLAGIDLCDSIIQLSLRVAPAFSDTVAASFFEGEQYDVGPHRFSRPGNYTALLSTREGCDSLIYLNLEHFEVFFPNGFSPNGDGQNDYFTIFGGDDLVAINHLRVFNRWGNLVFERETLLPGDEQNGWDGQFRGQSAPVGVYIYSAQLQMSDGTLHRKDGSVSLIR